MEEDAEYVADENDDDVGLVVWGFGEGPGFRGEEEELDDCANGEVED